MKAKLYSLGSIDGVERLQSQLLKGSDTANFIIEDGILKVWKWESEKGIGFSPVFNPEHYQII